jgi:hypothetical protein
MAVSMKLTMTQRDELIAAYLADEPVRNIAARFGVSQSYVFRQIRHSPRRTAVCTRVKIHQLKRMAERQDRLLAIRAKQRFWGIGIVMLQRKARAQEHRLRAAEHEKRALVTPDETLKAIHRQLAETYRQLGEQTSDSHFIETRSPRTVHKRKLRRSGAELLE